MQALIDHPDLPSLPEVAISLSRLLDEDANRKDIAALINTDSGLAFKTISLANSAFYKRQRDDITCIDEAVSVLGTDDLYDLVIAVAITRTFSGVEFETVNMYDFWMQSLRTAVAASCIAEHLECNHKGMIFAAGLLCYVGKMAIYIAAPGDAMKALALAKDNNISQHEAEHIIFGSNHADIGFEMLMKWNVPESIAEPVRTYLQPGRAKKDYFCASCILHLGYYSQFTFISNNTTRMETPAPMYQKAADVLGIDLQLLIAVGQQADNDVISCARSLGIYY